MNKDIGTYLFIGFVAAWVLLAPMVIAPKIRNNTKKAVLRRIK